MSQPSAEQFANALTEAVYRIKHLDGKSVRTVQDELGYALGKRGGASIEYWRKGNLPGKLADVMHLAQVIVQRSDLGLVWLLRYLESAGYPEPLQLGQTLFPQEFQTQATAVSNPPLLHNVPVELTPFIGREPELEAITRHLEDPDCRVLTLLGPGGIGKTRLAVAAARQNAHLFPDGLYFVPLAAVPAAESLPDTMCSTLGITLSNGVTAETALLAYLQPRHLLLILDNFEHLMDGLPLIMRLLQQAPHLQFLFTSRERLNLQGEWAYRVRGLPLPDAESDHDVSHYSAVQLFARSARRVRADFTLHQENLPYVVQICRLVEGFPLGIELAASWVRALSCQAIAAEIARSYAFLATPWRDMPERHRSLQAVFDYSWQLLTPQEQQHLYQLALFEGSFSWETAVSRTGISLWELSALVDKSFLYRAPQGDWYEMHEMLRQYALEKHSPIAKE